jgi:Holliday junction resolvase
VVRGGGLMTTRLTAAEGRALMAKADGMQPESVIVQQVRDYLRVTGWYVIRIQQGIGCHRGLSDLIAVKDGQTVFIECKTAKGKLSEHQEKFRAEIAVRGGRYVVARSIDDVMRLEGEDD